MGQKVNPIGFRLPVRRNWESRWFASSKDYPALVAEDYKIRRFLEKKLRYAAVPRISIERAGNRIRVKLFTGRPGVVIGRKGQELDKLREDLQKLTRCEAILDVQEVKKPDLVAQLVAENIALQLERRISTRRAMKKAIQSAMGMGALGIRICCSGRRGGAEIARQEQLRVGSVPLHSLRANVDYGLAQAYTVYGVIGVKCWLCTADAEQL